MIVVTRVHQSRSMIAVTQLPVCIKVRVLRLLLKSRAILEYQS